MKNIEWIGIKKFGPNPIGAIGFIGNDAVAIVAFYDDNDANKDGNVSFGEWAAGLLFSTNGAAVAEVAMQARVESDVILRDQSFNQVAINIFLSFAKGLIAEGIYKAYFGPGVQMIGSHIAAMITSSMVKQFVIRKGFEAAVKKIITGG